MLLRCPSRSSRFQLSPSNPTSFRPHSFSAGFRDAPRTVYPAAALVFRRGLSNASVEANAPTMENAAEDLLPDRLLTAALPFVPTHGFSSAAILAGAANEPELGRLSITDWTLTGLFPSTTKAANLTELVDRRTGPPRRTEPIGPAQALAKRWILEGNSRMKASLKSENLLFKQHGLHGVRRAFEIRLAYNRSIPHDFLLKALALVVTPKDPFFGVPLPVELPHILPYGSHALDVATDALAALCDYSKSREWMLRRIRLAGVYSAIELSSIAADLHPDSISSQIQKLLDASEALAAHTANTVEFISYVNRSQKSIIRSLGLI